MSLCEFSVIIYFELFDLSKFLYNSPVHALFKIHRHMLCHISFVLSIWYTVYLEKTVDPWLRNDSHILKWFMFIESNIFIPSKGTFERRVRAKTAIALLFVYFVVSYQVFGFFCFNRFYAIPLQPLSGKWCINYACNNHNYGLENGNPYLESKTFCNSALKWVKRNNDIIPNMNTVISRPI